MKHLDLFSGIGGFSLVARSLGIETVQFVEINPYCCHVLRKNFPGIPIHRDIRTFHAKPNQFDLITGGSPCQDLSIAGKKAGITGSRSGLWFEMLRIIEEAKPNFVIWENVKGAIPTGALLTVLSGLCEAGYCFDAEILSAEEIGLDHKRERIFVVAYSDGIWWDAPPWREQIGCQIEAARLATARQSIEPPTWGIPHGLPHRLDRLAAIGNAVIPALAEIALKRVLYLDKSMPQQLPTSEMVTKTEY
jgi:DNA (cytosine-5)-methyltransferase 1